jgi:hypothetical protein
MFVSVSHLIMFTFEPAEKEVGSVLRRRNLPHNCEHFVNDSNPIVTFSLQPRKTIRILSFESYIMMDQGDRIV